MKKNVLVTGGAGFIGSHLCEYLINNGDNVVCLDNLYTGSTKKIRNLFHNSNFRFVEADVMDKFEGKFDEIYNLACPASPIHYQYDPVKTFKTSVLGAINMLELAKTCDAKILQASTSEVYGDPMVHPQPETYWGNVNTIGKRSCYDEGKRASETIFMDYRAQYLLRVKIIRIFNTYGPNMSVHDGRVVSNFIVQALKNKDITIYGDGSQTRSFQYVDNLVRGIADMMNTEDSFAGPLNLGSEFEFTILELAQKIIKLTRSKSKIIFTDLPSDDPKQRRPDLTLARKIINYNPDIDVETGLFKTIEYFREAIKTMG